MRYSPFESRTKQQADPDLNAQIAVFFANGGKAEQLPFGESAEKYLNRRQMSQEAWRLSQVKEKRAQK
jgi:hypothetical protein